MVSTRCEDWSTLHRTLPSVGYPLKESPPNWGTGASPAPKMTNKKIERFPAINSPMTRYVDDMAKTNRLFRHQ